MDLFVRESGPAHASPIVLLHGGRLGGWSWDPVVDRLPHYRCLAPDLPQFGRSSRVVPFEMSGAADAIADLIRERAGGRRVHVVGFSLGAQVAAELLSTAPELVDRAVLCGTIVNTLPARRSALRLADRLARSERFRRAVNRRFERRQIEVPAARMDDYRRDLGLCSSADLAHVVVASAGFTVPAGLARARTPTLFLSGSRETPVSRRWAALLAEVMPAGIDLVATGMRHDWPLRHPDLFARTADAWLSDSALPSEIRRAGAGRAQRRDRPRR